MFSQIGPLEIVLIIVILLVIFGPRRLPGLGKSLGRGMREFKDSITGDDKDKGADAVATRSPTLSQAPPAPVIRTPAERDPVDVTPEQRS